MKYAKRILSFLLAGALMFTSINMTVFAIENTGTTVPESQVTTDNASEITHTEAPTTGTPTVEPSQPEPTQPAQGDGTPTEQPATDVNPPKETPIDPDKDTIDPNGEKAGEKTDKEKTEEELAKEEAEKKKENKEKELAKETEEGKSEEETIKGYKAFENITTHYKLALDSLKKKFPKNIIALSNKEKEISLPIDGWKPIDNYDSKLGKYTFQPIFKTEIKIEDGTTMPILTVVVEDESDGLTVLIDKKDRQAPSARRLESTQKPLSSSTQEKYVPDKSNVMDKNFVRDNNIYKININDKDLIKQAIKEHGSVRAAINITESADVHYSSIYNSFYGKTNLINHAVILVGWDDNFPTDHFYEGCRPAGNGAWLVRNSWGLDDYGKRGYFWISYEDVSLINSNYVVAYGDPYVKLHTDEAQDTKDTSNTPDTPAKAEPKPEIKKEPTHDDDEKRDDIKLTEEEVVSHPQYEADETFKITFDPGKGKLPEGTEITKEFKPGDTYGMLPVPKRSDYEFEGWHLDTPSGIIIRDNQIISFSHDIKLVAEWIFRGENENLIVPDENVHAPVLLSQLQASCGDLIRMSSPTQLAKIYYNISSMNGALLSNPDRNSTEYKEAFPILEEYIYDGKVTIKAVAYKGLESSVVKTFVINVIKPEEDWGDVLTVDREQWTDATEVPMGMWISPESMKDDADAGENADGTMDYTGRPCTFTGLRVYCNKTLLEENKDYIIRYKNNVNAGNPSLARPPAIVVVGSGKYSQEYEHYFTINRMKLVGSNSVSDSINAYVSLDKQYLADGSPIIATGIRLYEWDSVQNLGRTIPASFYSVAYYDSYTNENNNTALTEKPGTKYVVLSMKGNYEGTLVEEYSVIAKDKSFDKNVFVNVVESRMDWSSSGVVPVINITDQSTRTPLSQGTDYDVKINYYGNGTYGNAVLGRSYRTKTISSNEEIKLTSVGRYEFEFVGKSNYEGIVKKNIVVTGERLSIDELSSSESWTGKPITPAYIVKSGGNLVEESVGGVKNYTGIFTDNTDTGTATLTVIGNNDCGWESNEVKKTFRINPYNINKDPEDRITFRLSTATMQKGGAKPTVTLQDKNGNYDLVEGKDYKLILSKNRGITTISNQPKAVIRGIGNYTGWKRDIFYIRKGNLEEAQIMVGALMEGNLGRPKTVVYLGGKLTEGANADYTTGYFIKQDGKWNEIGSDYKLKKNQEVLVVAIGHKNFGGKAQTITRVVEKGYDISKASFELANKTFTGGEQYITSADITRAVIGSAQLKYGDDYRIVEGSYIKNINTGVARVTLEGRGEYAGIKEVTFKITPAYMD